jgi:peptidoglycan hydrolase-like protein with peptidoglycan-binding domain
MNHGPTLQQGSSGPDVRRLQRLLVMLKDLDYVQIDGAFGPKTAAAVVAFQQGAGLAADGIAGPKTWQALPSDPHTAQIGRGAHGTVVTALQHGLRKYGGPSTPTDPGPADGAFGTKTEHAVKAYQSERGVAPDGIVGDATWWVPAGAMGATLASLSALTT